MAIRPTRRSISGLSLGASLPVRAVTSTGAIVAASGVDLGNLTLIPRSPDVVRNIFEKNRPGVPILRPEDLLALRVELRNCEIVPGSPPVIRKTGAGAGRLILHFPPQAITEETFFQPPPPLFKKPSEVGGANPNPEDQPKPEPSDPTKDETLREPPIRARIADESRLAFKLPAGTEIEYSLQGILTACRTLELAVAANAKPRAAPGRFISVSDLFSVAAVNALSVRSRAALAGHVAASMRLAARGGDMTTIRARQAGSNAAVLSRIPDRAVFRPGSILIPRPNGPKPGNPSAITTSIELPWRLIVSPHSGARWRHAPAPVKSAATQHVELWHTSMVTPRSDGTEIAPPYPDPNRTIRAVWAKSGSGIEGANPAMTPDWPTRTNQPPAPSNALPVPNTVPFRMPLDDFDRFQIAHLSSNFSVNGYAPQPVDTKLLMLSALGGWLDSRGAWDPPGLSVEEWVHRATMARDHYVKVVYRGFLCPLGCRVSLVKVSERKFHKDRDGVDPDLSQHAYLRQRFYIIIREHVLHFDDDAFHATHSNDGKVNFARQWPFSKVEILTERTPDLDLPDITAVPPFVGQLCFWPFVGGQPFRFQCAGTDLDGRRVLFDLPMIFMDNTVACPRQPNPATKKLDPEFEEAENNAADAALAFATQPLRNSADLDLQRVALATPAKPGDTAVEVQTMTFGAEAPIRPSAGAQATPNPTLRSYSDDLSRPVFVPKVVAVEARLGPVNQLTGSTKTNRIGWNARYLQFGFAGTGGPEGQRNAGEVFADIVQSAGMGMLDFSSQGDKSGGFVQPNIRPKALSRSAGPVMSDVTQFLDGQMEPGAGFPISPSDLPLPLLFGCIPLGELIQAVADITGEADKVPKFVSEAGTQVETFIGALVRLFTLALDLPKGPLGEAAGGLSQYLAKIEDLKQQAQVAPQALQDVVDKLNEILALQQALQAKMAGLVTQSVDTVGTAADFTSLPGDIAPLRARVAELLALVSGGAGAGIPANIRQQVASFAGGLDALLDAVGDLAALFAAGKDMFDALGDIVGDPNVLADLLSDGAALGAKLDALVATLDPFSDTLGAVDLIGTATKTAILNALGDVKDVLAAAGALAQLIEDLTGEELTIRFDWAPEIANWPAGAGKEIFRANDKRGFVVAVEGKVKKNGSSSPQISVTCSLKTFDLVLIGSAAFLELNFDRIVFSVDSKAKMDVDVLLKDIKFVGPLSFVETLRDLIPLDGFSDPPYLDISTEGIAAGFDLALPSVAVGVLNLSNLSLGAGFTVPFIGQPLSVAFNFCTREQPFCLTVYCFGGGGFFGVTIDPQGVQILEAAFEFGASISVDFGVASGGVEVMAGIYFRMEVNEASLTGYFRLGGHVDVLGLITASLELYLELEYQFSSGKCTGRASLTIEVSVLCFSGSVTVHCEKRFAGSNGDPTLRQMMGFDATLSLQDELAAISGPDIDYAWRDYVEAFG